MLGIPGSGKTTNFAKILNDLSQENIICYNSNDIKKLYLIRKYRIFKLISKYNFIFEKILKKFYKHTNIKRDFLSRVMSDNKIFFKKIDTLINSSSMNENEKKHVTDLFLETVFIYEIANITLLSDEYLFIDEGFFHKISTIFISKDIFIDINTLKDILFFYGKPNRVVYLKIDVPLAYNNITKRKSGLPKRMRKYSKLECYVHLENIKLLQENIVNLSIENDIEVLYYNLH